MLFQYYAVYLFLYNFGGCIFTSIFTVVGKFVWFLNNLGFSAHQHYTGYIWNLQLIHGRHWYAFDVVSCDTKFLSGRVWIWYVLKKYFLQVWDSHLLHIIFSSSSCAVCIYVLRFVLCRNATWHSLHFNYFIFADTNLIGFR